MIDTAEKRASAGNVSPIPLTLPIPDSTINAGDRAQVAAEYRGIIDGGGGGGGTAIFLRPTKVQQPL